MDGPSASVRVALLLVMILVAGITTVALTSGLPKPSTLSTTSTFSQAVASSSTVSPGAAVTFRQQGDCTPTVYTIPWAVEVFGTAFNGTYVNDTEVSPAGSPVPHDGGGFSAGAFPSNESVINFASVPNGSFQYNVFPSQAFYNPSDFVAVNGTAVTVYIEGPAVSCVTTTHSSTTTSTASLSSITILPGG